MDLSRSIAARVRQLTAAPQNHVLTNCNVFSPNGQWIVYDVRSNQGGTFDGDRIERVHVANGTVETLFRGKNGAGCGVVTHSPVDQRIAFIYGPENPTTDFSYGPARRQGVLLDTTTHQTSNLDARDLGSPYTPGALRGGTHVHVFSPDGTLVSCTYDDYVLETLCSNSPPLARGPREGRERLLFDVAQRTLAISVLDHSVEVPRTHPRNHAGDSFTVVVAETTNDPVPGSDQISRAFEEAWIGTDGYLRPDGTRQRKALAFQGHVKSAAGETISEVFVVDLPDDLTRPGERPLQGTQTTRPAPPLGCVQRRFTFTAGRKYPGIQGPRHWLRSSPDGSRIAFLMKDDAGIAQLWTISPNGGEPTQNTRNPHPIASAFTWSPCGQFVAHAMDGDVCVTSINDGTTRRVTNGRIIPRPEACVFSPDGSRIAFVAPVTSDHGTFDQIFVAE